jgi:mannose-1-phosphate guanylyltransferase
MYAVIIAGGIGKRFWPRSRRERPKQLLDIIDNFSMLETTYNRLKGVTDERKIFIITGQGLKDCILKKLPDFPLKNLIIEPSGKNTAPAIGLAATLILAKDPQAVIGIFPADHLIRDQAAFAYAVNEGVKFARDHNALVTFGIKPTRPATGYGYIQFDKNSRVGDSLVYKVKTFAEKPNLETAQRFLESGVFLWNSGMFIWRGVTIMNAYKLFLPEMYECFRLIGESVDTPDYETVLKRQWATIRSISVDYGIMEHAKNVYVVLGDFDWSDVGSWDAVYELKPKDDHGNVLTGDILTIETENCYIHSRKLFVATIGVKDLVVVQSKDSLLIVKRGQSEKVKEVVDWLERERKGDHT